MSQSSLLRRLEYAWIGTGALAVAAGAVCAVVALNWALGGKRPETVGTAEITGVDASTGSRWPLNPDFRGASGGVLTSTSSSQNQGLKTVTSGKFADYAVGDWVQAYDPVTSRWRPAAVAQLHPDELVVRYCDELNIGGVPPEHGKKADQVHKWDVNGDARAKLYAGRVPRRAPVNPAAVDFRPGEEVMVLSSSPAGARARVVEAVGMNVVVRWEDSKKDDVAIAPAQLRLVNWGPFDRIDPVPASLVPKSVSTAAGGMAGVKYMAGQQVEAIFRGTWVSGEVVGTADDQYVVLLRPVGVLLNTQSTRMRMTGGLTPGVNGGGFAGIDPKIMETRRTSSMTPMSPSLYKDEDEVEVNIDGQWVARKIKRVDGGRMVLYPREAGGPEEVRPFSMVRVPRELAQKRMEERMASMRQGTGFTQQGGIPMGGQTVPQGREALAASDCRVGMAVTAYEPGRVTSVPGRVSRVEGEQVYVTVADGKEVVRSVDMLTTSRAERPKAAGEYQAGERVYVRWDDSNVWSINRVEKIEGDSIILRWGQVAESSQGLRTRTATDVRPMKMDEKAK